jgi:hypothetical protein
MKKYLNSAIVLQVLSIIYTIVHNYYFMSQYVMMLAALMMIVIGFYLYWQCYSNSEIKFSKKVLMFLLASVPFIGIITGIVFISYLSQMHF